jgi:pantoate kinase
MFLVGSKVFSFVVKGGQSHILRGSKGVGVTIESYGKVEISYLKATFEIEQCRIFAVLWQPF